MKRLAEGSEAGEPDVEADIGDASIRATEQVERPLDAAALQIPMRGLPERRVKLADEVRSRHARDARERWYVERPRIRFVSSTARVITLR